MVQQDARTLIEKLNLAPHPEGGHYRQTWVGGGENTVRACASCIYFLLAAGERSHWHWVDADEIWLFHAGAPLELSMSETETGPAHVHSLGPDILTGQAPQIRVPEQHWQSARSTGAWTLVSCIVAPAFSFDGFTLAPQGFDIPSA